MMVDAGTIVLAGVLSINFTLCFGILARTVARLGAEENNKRTVVIEKKED